MKLLYSVNFKRTASQSRFYSRYSREFLKMFEIKEDIGFTKETTMGELGF